MKLNRETTTKEKAAIKIFENIKPFTITINNGMDAMFLSAALMTEMTGSQEVGKLAMQTVAAQCGTMGVEEAVKEMLATALESGLDYPEFLQPLLILMFNHMVENKIKTDGLLRKEKE